MCKIQKEIRSIDEFVDCSREMSALYEYEKLLSQICKEQQGERMQIPGYCELCEKKVRFEVDFDYSGGEMLNYRERLSCPHCGFNSRQRMVVAAIKEHVQMDSDIYMYEQVTPVYDYVKQYYLHTIGSEYLNGEDKRICGRQYN